jgi:hypothetical protein
MQQFKLSKPVSELSNQEIASILFQLSTEVSDRLKMDMPMYATDANKYLSRLALAIFDTEACEGYLIAGGKI